MHEIIKELALLKDIPITEGINENGKYLRFEFPNLKYVKNNTFNTQSYIYKVFNEAILNMTIIRDNIVYEHIIGLHVSILSDSVKYTINVLTYHNCSNQAMTYVVSKKIKERVLDILKENSEG